MATWLKKGTSVTIKLGPFVDSSDGFTPMTALSISVSDVRIAKHGDPFVAKNESTAPTHDENGWYSVTLDEVDTEDNRELIVAVNKTGALPVWREFLVVEDQTYGALVQGTETLVVDATASVWSVSASSWQGVGSFGWTIGDRAAGADESIHTLTTQAIDAAEAIGGLVPSAPTIANYVWGTNDLALWDPGTAGKALSDVEIKTAGLTFTVAGAVDSNVEHVNGTEVTGSGTGGDPWQPV